MGRTARTGQPGRIGLRELKKEQTRQHIADTAWRLFTERGFEPVSVAEIAREAQVADATVFNYFASKEDLFYSRLEAFGGRLADAVSGRPPSAPALAAFRGALLAEGGLLHHAAAGDREAFDQLKTINRVIAASPALRAREQQALARNTVALAAVLAADTGAADGDPIPMVVANALMGVQRTLIDVVRSKILAETEPAQLAADIQAFASSAFALLERGLGDYAPKPPEPGRRPA